MSRISIPASIDAAPQASQPLLQAVKKQLGSIPNMFRLVAHSPAALEGYLGMSAALNKGTLSELTRERIALAVAAINGCSYCQSAHAYIGKHVAKLDETEIAANLSGSSNDAKAAVAVGFAVKVVQQRGHISDADLQSVRDAGYSDAEVVEIVQHVALNTWTNYINEVARTVVDFPVMDLRKAG